jgi:hypothetical protein
LRHNRNINVKDYLKNDNSTREIIDLNVQPFDIIVLPNNQILSSNYNDKCLTLYNDNFSLINKIDKINGEVFIPYGIILDENKMRLYISERKNHQILMTDIAFNRVKSVGSLGNTNNQFNDPCGLCFGNNNKYIYICDNKNQRIQTFTKELEFSKSLKVDYLPWTIKASSSMLCIESGNIPGIYFYNLQDFYFVQKINHGYCRISEINSVFYEFNNESKRLFCYDKNGELKEEIVLNGAELAILSHVWDGILFNYNDNLFMASYSKGKIIKFSTN